MAPSATLRTSQAAISTKQSGVVLPFNGSTQIFPNPFSSALTFSWVLHTLDVGEMMLFGFTRIVSTLAILRQTSVLPSKLIVIHTAIECFCRFAS